ADHDQAASDRDLALGTDPYAHEHSRNARERTTHDREQSARERDETAGARLSAADQRDAIATSRDLAAQHRDEAAAARTVVMAELEATMERQEDAREHRGADAIIRAAGQRRRAAERRAQAAEYRELAADDRRAAARDREQAAQERLNALSDREALAAEMRVQDARIDQAVRHQQRAEQLARTLQQSLSPPSLPHIAGIDVAVHYEPAAPEDVGGDFYDLFPLTIGRSGFFLGDVCGKGPEAAAVTSLARYTMRTAAMLHETPDAILMDLNAALLMQNTDPIQTCTTVYGEIDMSGATASITLAVGGHPPPLVIRADGSVETTPARGPILGAVDEPVFQTCELRFDVGDALVVYSDGILDAVTDGVPVDEQRISDVLAEVPHASATDLVGALLDSMRRTDRALRDDVAFIALRHVGARGSSS
ncbi:MAG: serine/threonine-protein phosphatase, partial [Actinobacteria bacterium]|nr:serine/threonine-protein phosphatase [Actinomycetota bacterium]